MLLNKSAGFGPLPPAVPRRPSAVPAAAAALAQMPGAIGNANAATVGELGKLKTSIDGVAAAVGGKAPPPGVIPTGRAFPVLARLNAVRAALYGSTTGGAAARKLVAAGGARATTQIHSSLLRKDRQLAGEFINQFRPVSGNFSRQRRERLAELAAVEAKVTAIVT